MKIKRYILGALLAGAVAFGATAANHHDQKGINHPMTQAMLRVFEQQLKADPTDYEVFMNRANEYYRLSEYMKALEDVNNALRYIPKQNKDVRVQALALRANIYEVTKKPQKALEDLTEAVKLDPTSYILIYQKANAEFEVGNYAAANAGYRRLVALNPRSLEGYIGQARVAVKEQNMGTANEMADRAVAIDQTNPEAYIRRASVRHMMGNDSGAVDDLLMALGVDSSNRRALRELLKLSNDNYGAVMAGLSTAVKEAPRSGMFYYIRAIIAQTHYRYLSAIQDFQHIIDENLYDYAGIYASMSECQMALGRYGEAMQSINTAITMDFKNIDYYVQKARVYMADGKPEFAEGPVQQALLLDASAKNALQEKGLVMVAEKQYDEAAQLFGEVTMMDNEAAYPYMLRAWVLKTYLNQPVAAIQFYNQVVDVLKYEDDDPDSYRGFALLFLNRPAQGKEWIEGLLKNNADADGRRAYLAACFYAQAGEIDKALEYTEQALQRGYANYYDWTVKNDARINVEPLRGDARFGQLLEKYGSIFGR